MDFLLTYLSPLVEHFSRLQLHRDGSALDEGVSLNGGPAPRGSASGQVGFQPRRPVSPIALMNIVSAFQQVARSSDHGSFGLKETKNVTKLPVTLP